MKVFFIEMEVGVRSSSPASLSLADSWWCVVSALLVAERDLTWMVRKGLLLKRFAEFVVPNEPYSPDFLGEDCVLFPVLSRFYVLSENMFFLWLSVY